MTQNTNTETLLTIAGQQYDLSNHTPMMVQYLTMKAQYPHALLLYRMGDFYELFFEDAKLAAQILDITLTRRGTDKAGNTIAMAGVPFHAADSYMARLIAAGKTVVVCEQVEETSNTQPQDSDNEQKNPSQHAKSDHKKGLMHREVVRTLTAGTLTDDALIAPDKTPTVVAIDLLLPTRHSSETTQSRYQAGISQLDLAAGKLVTQALTATSPEALQSQMLTTLARFAPSECIISESMDEDWQTWLQNQLDCPLLSVAAADFHRDHAPATICQQFEVRQVDGLGIGDQPLLQSSCAALIHYARQTQQRQVPHVNQLIVEYANDYLIIDAGSQRNLEIFEPASSQGTPLISVLNHCKTPMGKRLLQQQLKRPLRNQAVINQRLDAIDTLLSHAGSELLPLRETLAAIADIERISGRIGLASAKPRDLKRLADSIISAMTLSDQLANSAMIIQPPNLSQSSGSVALLPSLILQLPSPTDPAYSETVASTSVADIAHSDEQRTTPVKTTLQIANLIHQAIVEEPPAHTRDGGMIATGYDADFDRLTHLHDNIEQTLDDMAEAARQQYQLASLKVGFNKVSGFYFELPKAQAALAPEHFIRRQTLKNCERFITDELKTIETDYLGAQSQALIKEKQLYNELLATIAQALPELQSLSQAIAQLDVLINWALLAQKYQWNRPKVSNDPTLPALNIRRGRHAVVEAAIKQPNKHQQAANTINHFVANDCVLGTDDHPERLLLITGPNMGGKSTYMRQTALIVLLACCGSFVPAKSASIGDIDRIFTRIGSADDLAGGKSTFMVEMIETAHILNLATDKSLVLMDEVGRGTSTTDGLAIAHACVQRLAQMGCLTLFATHYFELTQLADQSNFTGQIRNVHVAASDIDGQLLLLHQIKDGAASSSFGLHVAKMAGIPQAVLNDAQQYLEAQLSQSTSQATAQNSSVEPSTIDKNHTSQPLSSTELHDKSDLAKSSLAKDELQLDLIVPDTTAETDLTAQAQDSMNNHQYQQNQYVEIKTTLDKVNPDELTPKQAHDLLYQLKQLASSKLGL